MKNNMKSLFLLLFTALSCFAQESYKNPIISGFYPDPSVCRVNDDYYLVNSTFHYFPGVPLFHSKDLIHWEQIGNCLSRPSQLNLSNTGPSGGIYAPTIRYHDGIFYMITTNVSAKGNFMVTTSDPRGEWSEPICLRQGGIDPPLYFEDGKCYMTSIPGYGISLCEIDPQTGEQLTETVKIWNGTGGRYPEGPHIYKKDGWYWLLIAEGGTEYGHKVTIARSRDIYGPYESNPANPILTHINMNAQSNPIQGIGHADFVQAHDNSWWVVCLGFRPQSGLHHLLGRETLLAPVSWEENAWPVVNGDGTLALSMNCPTLPQTAPAAQQIRTTFNGISFGPEWNWLYNPVESNYSLTARPGFLRLKATPVQLDDPGSPTFIGRRQQHIACEVTTALSLAHSSVDDEAGLTVYMTHEYHYDLYLKQLSANKQAVVLSYRLGRLKHIEKEVEIPSGIVSLRVDTRSDDYTFYYSIDGNKFHELGKMDTRFISSETAGGFTGVYFGLFAQGEANTTGGADFEWLDYRITD